MSTLRGGGAGCITATGNVNPAAIMHLYKHWQDAGADEAQLGLNSTRALFQQFPMIAAMKAAIARQSGDAAWATVRPPLVELDPQQTRQLTDALLASGFEIPAAASLAMETSV